MNHMYMYMYIVFNHTSLIVANIKKKPQCFNMLAAKPSHRKPHGGNGHHTDAGVVQTDLTAILQSINQAGCGGSRISPSVSYIVGGTEARANSWPWMVFLSFICDSICYSN